MQKFVFAVLVSVMMAVGERSHPKCAENVDPPQRPVATVSA